MELKKKRTIFNCCAYSKYHYLRLQLAFRSSLLALRRFVVAVEEESALRKKLLKQALLVKIEEILICRGGFFVKKMSKCQEDFHLMRCAVMLMPRYLYGKPVYRSFAHVSPVFTIPGSLLDRDNQRHV